MRVFSKSNFGETLRGDLARKIRLLKNRELPLRTACGLSKAGKLAAKTVPKPCHAVANRAKTVPKPCMIEQSEPSAPAPAAPEQPGAHEGGALGRR